MSLASSIRSTMPATGADRTSASTSASAGATPRSTGAVTATPCCPSMAANASPAAIGGSSSRPPPGARAESTVSAETGATAPAHVVALPRRADRGPLKSESSTRSRTAPTLAARSRDGTSGEVGEPRRRGVRRVARGRRHRRQQWVAAAHEDDLVRRRAAHHASREAPSGPARRAPLRRSRSSSWRPGWRSRLSSRPYSSCR